MIAVLEALCLFSHSFQAKFITESDFNNVVMWASHVESWPWRLQFHFNDIKKFLSCIDVAFCHVIRSANSRVDGLAKQEVDRASPWVTHVM